MTIAPQAPAQAAGFRSFDAVTTVSERGNIWKHMALIGNEYAIFNDAGLIQGPTRIAAKWPFLPEAFTHDIDSAGVYFSNTGYRWQHRWTKGNQMITFEDTGVIRQETLPVARFGEEVLPIARYDALALSNNGGRYCCVNGTAFFGDKLIGWLEQAPGLPTTLQPSVSRIADVFPFIPAQFTFDLDDISYEEDKGTYSFYKGNERIVAEQAGRNVVEFVNLDRKWSFLNAWRSM